MQTIRTYIESFTKESIGSPWVIALTSPTTNELVRLSVGENGEVEAGPRLSEVLSIMERRIATYPFQFTYHKQEQNNENDYLTRMYDNIFVYMEAGIGAYRSLITKDFLQYGKITITSTYDMASSDGVSAQYVAQDDAESSPSESVKDASKIDINLGLGSSDKTNDTDTIVIQYEESPDNRLQFVKPLDDRQEQIWGDKLVDDRVRIGDVLLVIPPMSIQVNRASTINKEKVLRSKSSIMTKTNGSTQTITLQLYFHDLESINGRAWDNGLGNTYYMDGLRPLIAQFKKAPFLPIDNEYINNTLDIHDVALVSLNVTTVPNFPQSLAATLILAKFETEAYMPGVASLGDVINYPLMRWYYQEVMKTHKSPYRTSLKALDRPLTNEFQFSIADESQLAERQDAIKKLRESDTPAMLQAQIDDATTEIGKQVQDGIAAQAVMKVYNKYMDLMRADKLPDPRSLDELISYNSSNKVYKQDWIDLYGSKLTTGSSVTAQDNWYAAYQSDASVDAMAAMTQEWRDAYEDVKEQGIFRLKLYSQANIKMFNETEIKGSTVDAEQASLNGRGTYVIVPGSDMLTIQRVIDRGYDASKQAQDKAQQYNKLQALVEQTEGALTLNEFPIDGLIPISLNVVYENTFIPVQMEANNSPTLQYLGSQDPYIQIAFHASQEAVQGIRELLNKVEYYSSQYRLGITSGFVGVTNPLLSVFGVTTIMPETVTFATIEGMPGHSEIQMTVYGFNKTQKRMETLEGISPIYADTTKDDRYGTSYDSGKDNAVIEQKMKRMEVYADLELPQFDELNDALPKIGANLDYFENRTNARFLDPDFYVSTDWTFREYVRQMREKEHRADFTDFAGLKMYTSTTSENPIQPADDATMQSIYKLDSDTPDVADGSFTTGADSFQNGTFTSSSGNTDGMGMSTNKPADVKAIQDWLNKATNINTIPSYNDWLKWGVGKTKAQYTSWLNRIQPKEELVYNAISKYIDEHFIGAKGWIYNDKKDTSDAWQKATYSDVHDVWYASYRVMAAKNPKMPKIKDDKENIKTSDYKKFAMVTRERVFNYIKAVFDVQSGWRQLRADNKPKINFDKDNGRYNAGIGNIDIAAFASNTTEAQRLLWDWTFNLEKTMYYLYGIYLEAAASKDYGFASHPWDWMVYGFGEGKFAHNATSQFYESVIRKWKERYNSFGQIYATPTYAVNPSIMKMKDGLSEHQYKVITGEKDALLTELKKAGMSQSKIDDLKKKSDQEVRSAYEDYMSQTYEPASPSAKQETNPSGNKYMDDLNNGKQAAADGKVASNKDDKEVYENFKLYQEIHDKAQEETNKLVNDVDPYTIFKEMFTDMIDYDMRGRFTRAFPTFQLFIIDEGRWMGNYKLWDNLYGYNAIQSIDVHRSRKIAADTAVIRMTNVYSNLTSRPMSDTQPDTNNYDFWDNLVFNNPSDKLIESRKQLVSAMLLQTGARIHLRIGYGSNVEALPVVFNGQITELDTSEIVEIVCQGDGLELTNVISADPEDENRTWWKKTKEPRDFLCELMTSKGNWIKNAVNWSSDGRFFKDNPLGIQHFGNPMDAVWANVSWNPYNNQYGEVCQNIYSANQMNTFSDYVFDRTGANDEKDQEKQERIPMTWTGFIPNFDPGDEPNITMKLYGKTVWDVAQNFANCVPDYIAAVHPFETRSTLFYGRPWWRVAYRYSSKYQYDATSKEWVRTLTAEHRKPYMQFHFVDSHMDIVGNNIQANADFSNVVTVEYDGGELTQPIYADYDIYFANQRTKHINVDVVSKPKIIPGWNFFTAEKQAMYAGMSVLRDECKDMYQGSLTVLGSPTIKPYDMIYMNDTMHEMNGNFLVKSVTHHFSYDTGFVTSIEPDALVVNDDKAMMGISNWWATAAIGFASGILSAVTARRAAKKVFATSLARKAVSLGKKGGTKATQISVSAMAKGLPSSDPDVENFKIALKEYMGAKTDADKKAGMELLKEAQSKLDGKIAQWETEGMFKTGGKNITGVASKLYMKGLLSGTKNMVTALEDGTKAFKILRMAQVMTAITPLSIIADLAIQWGVETLLEQWRRKKACYQAVLMMPLKYQGRNYEAGINGHMGMVVGDTQQGKMDNFLSGLGFKDGDILDGLFKWYGEAMNALSGDDRQYIYKQSDFNNGN